MVTQHVLMMQRNVAPSLALAVVLLSFIFRGQANISLLFELKTKFLDLFSFLDCYFFFLSPSAALHDQLSKRKYSSGLDVPEPFIGIFFSCLLPAQTDTLMPSTFMGVSKKKTAARMK